MDLKQVATLLNTTLVPNVLGEGTTIAEDLSNVIDLGTAMTNLTADQLKDYTKTFVAGVSKTYFDSRIYEKVTSLFRDFTEYGGVVQRVKSGLMSVTDDVSTNLQNGTSYDPNVFKGMNYDTKVYTKDCGFVLEYSVPHNMWRSIRSAEDIMRIVEYISNRAENTMNVHLYALDMTVKRAIAYSKASKRIKAVTYYNTNVDTSANLTAATAMESPEFLRWFAWLLMTLRKSITDIGTKNNEGGIETFTPMDDTVCTMLGYFADKVMVNMESDTYHNELVSLGSYDTVNFWQNSGDDIVPDFDTISSLKGKITGAEDDDIEIDNLVCLIYDRYTAGVTSKPENVTTQYNGKGDFTNYWDRIYANYFLDLRNNAIAITLE